MALSRKVARFDSSSPIVQELLAAWHEAGRAESKSHTYDADLPKVARPRAGSRRRWIELVEGHGEYGKVVYLVDCHTYSVWTVNDYGVRAKFLGSVDDVIRIFRPRKHPTSTAAQPAAKGA